MVLFIPWLSWPLLVLLLIALFFIYMCRYFRTFSKQGIPVAGTPLPIFGTMLPALINGLIIDGYGKLEKYGKTYGSYSARRPVLNTVDFEIIRDVFIKDQATCPNRRNLKLGNPLFDGMLNTVSDPGYWKFLRSMMSPTFSSGKLKRMMPLINKCATQMTKHLVEHSKEGNAVEMKEFSGSYTMDVIASTAFGLDLNTKEDHNNPFVKNAKAAFNFSLKHPIFIIMFFFPFLTPLLPYLKLRIFKKEITDFFTDVTNQVCDARSEDDEKVDFIGLMMNSHKELQAEGETVKRALTRQEIISQAILFFLAGYETTATTISFLAYNLACYPKKQEKLIEEIDLVIGNKENIHDEDLHKMPYLEMCINESLRLFPPALRVDRVAESDVVLKGMKLPAGSTISIPVYHMHHFAEFYPDPEKFIPERFSSEEKAKRDPLSFLPFGCGPRQCIASRLALLEVKIAMISVLRTHKFVMAPETEVPIKLGKMGLLKAENGIWLRIEERCQK